MEPIMKRITRAVLLATALSVVGCSALAQEYKKIDGDYIFTIGGAKSLVELGFIIRGQAAKELYATMPFKAKADACTGGVKKADLKGFFCIKEKSGFTCSLGIVLKTREVTAGPLSC